MSARTLLRLLFVSCCWLLIASERLLGQTGEPQLASERFENIVALDQMPADHMGKVMNLINQSLGVSCQYCHDGNDFAKEKVGRKDAAREMIQMTLKLNRENFQGPTQVTCFTCHRGHPKPIEMEVGLMTPQIANTPASNARGTESASVIRSTVDDVLQRYRRAVVGTGTEVRSLHLIGERQEPNGQVEKEEVWWSSDGQWRQVTTYGALPITEAYDGQRVSKRVGEAEIKLKPDETMQIKLESLLLTGGEVDVALSNLRVETAVRLEERSALQLVADGSAGTRERLFFDSESGLLLRRISTLKTMLGNFDYQVDYGDYRQFASVKIPTTVRFSMPSISWTRVVRSVEVNGIAVHPDR